MHEGRDEGDTRADVKQIFPASITGKGARGTGEGASVLEHAFGKGDPYTLGVEEEYMLLDPDTWDLVQHIDSVLEAVGGLLVLLLVTSPLVRRRSPRASYGGRERAQPLADGALFPRTRC